MIKTLNKHAENLKAIFDMEGEEGQFEYLIDIGKKSNIFDERDKNEDNKMSGCLAQVWIKYKKDGNKNFFVGDSDALIVKGLVTIISEAMSGLTTSQIKEVKHNVIDKLGLGPSLSARRQVGMMAMIDYIKIITGAK
tara:strand:- start:1567 stop:1977 length:411 start_codon:yes stop_codon:yes gene_type:complete